MNDFASNGEVRPTFADNPHYVKYETLLKELNDLFAVGKGDSEVADVLRDEMEIPYRHLNRAERDRLGGLSADLYMLQNDEVFEPATLQERLAMKPSLYSAFRKGQWEVLLSLLRKGPANLAQHEMAYVRAIAYARLEHTDTSLQFIKYAAELSPSSMKYKGAVLGLAIQLGKADVFEEMARFCMEKSEDALVVFLAAYTLISVARLEGNIVRLREVCSYVLTKLNSIAQRADFGAVSSEAKAVVYIVCAVCYKILGLGQEAETLRKQAVQHDPDTEETYQILIGDLPSSSDFLPRIILSNNFAVAAANPFASELVAA